VTAPADPVAAHAFVAPDRVAVIDGDERTTYSALNAEVNRLANGLRGMGVASGERLIWCAPNSRQVLVTMHACRKLGLVAIPLAYRLTAAEMAFVVQDSGASVLVAHAEQAPSLPEAAHRVVFGGTHPGWTSWDALVIGSDAGEPPLPDPGGLGTAMMYTSGTTGRPKGAVRSRTDRALLGAMLAELRFPGGEGEIHITTGPLYHAGPNAFALITHLTGGTVVMRRFDAAEWVALVPRHRVTSTFCTPTHMKRVVALPGLDAADFSSLRSLIVNAAPVPYSLKEEIVATLGDGFLFEVYGSTELGIDTVLRPEDQLRKPGSCGRPYGGIELKIVDGDGREAPPGQEGDLYVRTPMAVDGYHGAAGKLRALDADWKSVGDIAYLDDEGYLYICDRRDDLIITGGMNVYPAEVEAVLHAHPDVQDAAVIGVPDDEWGQRVHAVVQPWAGRDVDLDGLAAHAAQRLAGYKRPRSWEVRAELPRTESGKLLKRELRASPRPA
jgi:acyl-CoA synthetase (AMP-forming)/AMP-acid ligase II